MSSVPENSSVPLDVVNKRKVSFTRSDSFDKFLYTAIYTLQYFQLAGTLLSQKSLLQFLDELQYKSRVIFEKYATDTLSPRFKKMYAVILVCIVAFIRYSKFNGIFETPKKVASNTGTETDNTYVVRVQKQNEAVSSKDVTKLNDLTEEKRFKCCTDFDPIHSRSTSPLKSWRSTDSEIFRQNIGMVVIVYGSATLVYIQLMFLAAFLQTATTPPHLVLVFSLAYITYIVFKMGFAKTKTKDESTSPIKSTKSASTAEDTVGELPIKRNGRLSRSSTQRFLYFHNKTLSKIKLL
ncbi:uncharacterized protein LOC116347078 [Contarinia nasturtii]|uniref:uncharacterized protein LOC116347078 n=1 Tax=Contarinia nasturtii TaxID=265458 RepID=UPI0012D3EE11|nr:uncharacterized protein LOC116347078 [Contarinia nasturtii]